MIVVAVRDVISCSQLAVWFVCSVVSVLIYDDIATFSLGCSVVVSVLYFFYVLCDVSLG